MRRSTVLAPHFWRNFFSMAAAMFLAAALLASVASGQETCLGDKGCDHEYLHPLYQQLFSQGKCNCKSGECRPADYRLSQASPTGLEIEIDRSWYPVPEHALLNKNYVPPELWAYPAHVCAFPLGGVMKIECVIINSGV